MRHIIINGDLVTFLPTFGSAIVTPIPTTISGTASQTKVSNQPACLEGDEKNVASPGCMYIAPPYVVPGTGTLKIQALAGDQLSKSTEIEGKKVILKGVMFDAVFEVQSPAMDPVVGTPDPLPKHSGGKGMFTTTNVTVEDQ